MIDTPWDHLTTMLATRSGSRCEGCGRLFVPGKIDPSRHHRHPGKMGGRKHDPNHNDLTNLLLLCGGLMAGVWGCHGDAESFRRRAYATGFLVREDDDPADVPVTLYSGRIVYLDKHIGYIDTGRWAA